MTGLGQCGMIPAAGTCGDYCGEFCAGRRSAGLRVGAGSLGFCGLVRRLFGCLR
jgi:hypothetical protein